MIGKNNLTLSFYINLSNNVDMYYKLSIVPIGILSNLITILVSMQKGMNKTNMGFFYNCIATANIAQLVFYLFIQKSKHIFNYDLYLLSDVSCKIFKFLRRIIRQLSPLIDTVMTLERFMSVYYPSRMANWRNKSLPIKFIISGILIFAFIDTSNLFYYLETKVHNSHDLAQNFATKVCTSSRQVLEFSDIGANVLRLFLPFILMSILNMLIIKKMIGSKSKLGLNLVTNSLSSKRQNNFTIAVINMNGMFLILNLPLSVFFICKYSNLEKFNSSKHKDIFVLIFTICYEISTLHYVSLLFMSLKFNHTFLNEFKKIFRLTKTGRKKLEVIPIIDI